ncbi:GntR family transcriptional regulator, partial [Bordetella bronchiseptica]|uniref:GntR family transcriptional regulator n=1 Tax=Bordetella bronchiseptica TaxID=518 RepID=UPI003F50759C
MDFAAILQQAPPAGARLPLQRQLLQRFKNAILDGRLAPGSRLPASRALAQQLGISRNTVLLAYEHLAAEGYVRADRQGTRVAGLARAGMPARATNGVSDSARTSAWRAMTYAQSAEPAPSARDT